MFGIKTQWCLMMTHSKGEALGAHVGNSNREQISEREEPNLVGKGALTPTAGPGRTPCEWRPGREGRQDLFENQQHPIKLHLLCDKANLKCLSFSKLLQHVPHAANRLFHVTGGRFQLTLPIKLYPNRSWAREPKIWSKGQTDGGSLECGPRRRHWTICRLTRKPVRGRSRFRAARVVLDLRSWSLCAGFPSCSQSRAEPCRHWAPHEWVNEWIS